MFVIACTLLGLLPALPHGGSFSPPPAPPPSNPGPSNPLSPGSGGPRGPGATGGPGPTTPGPGAAGGRNDLHWSHWWVLERDSYLGLRERVRATRPQAEGRSALLDAAGIPPSRTAVVASVLPAILAVLANERGDDMITAALVAAARIGADGDDALASTIAGALMPHLTARSQEVSETAALALGILGEPVSLAPLLSLARGTPAGVALVQRSTVPARTRAFACFGLGLLARHQHNSATRQTIALALIEILGERHALDDVPVAATMAFGLCALPVRPTLPPRALRSHVSIDAVLSRSAQCTWLAQRLSAKRSHASNAGAFTSVAVRAHGYATLARLASDADRTVQSRAIALLTASINRSSETTTVRAAATLGLGEVTRADAGEESERALRALKLAMRNGQPLERRFATIALARAASRPGEGDDGLAAADGGRQYLLRQMTRGRSGDQPWSALALGVQAHALRRLGDTDSDAAGRPLANELRKQRNASDIGAYALGCALACEGSDGALREIAGEATLAALERIKDPQARGHIALALGLLRYEPARDELRRIARAARFQPGLLWSASVGLGLIGDEGVTPLLVEALSRATSSSSRAAAASALGHVGDRRALAPLLKMVTDVEQPVATRAFAIVALGVVCDESPLPWRTPLAHALPYFALTSTLVSGSRGLLEIL